MDSDLDHKGGYCQELVSNTDNDRYLASLLAPEAMRDHLWSLYAFDAEISGIRAKVSEPQIGEIRYQWWLDTLDQIYEGRGPDHPVAIGLSAAIRHADLPRHAFVNLIEARRFDLYDDPMPTLNDLEGYLGETSSALMQMAARVLVGETAFALSDVVGLAGVAYGITDLLRNLAVHGARGQCYIPLDLLEKCDLTPAHAIAGRRDSALDVVVSQLRHHAQIRLTGARRRTSQVPVGALPAIWPASLVDLYLKRMSRAGFNPFKKSAQISQLRRQARLMKMSLTEAF